MRAPVIALAAALAVAGCHKAANTSDGAAAASAAPVTQSGLSVSDGRLVLPAVAGNPAAAYFTLANDGHGSRALDAVTIAGAESAEMHQTQGGSMAKVDRLESDPGTRIAFAPGGLHVMAFKLRPGLKPGDKVEMTLNFDAGDKLSVPLTVAAPGADPMGDMH